jgi:hypothetical protein
MSDRQCVELSDALESTCPVCGVNAERTAAIISASVTENSPMLLARHVTNDPKSIF